MVGLNPLSDVGYKIAYSELNESNIPTGRQNFTSIGNGGIYQVFAAAAGTFWNRLSIGAQANYCFGNINKSAAMTYEASNARSWACGDSLQVNNFSAKLGLQYEQPIGRGSSLILGGTYKVSTPIAGYHNHYEVKGVDRSEGRYQELLKEKSLRMGNEIGVGLSYKKGDDLLIEFDYTMTDWTGSGFESVVGFSNNGDVPFVSSVGQSFRLGGELTPNRNDIRYFLKRCTYRAGAYFDRSYYTVGGAHVDAVGVTLGMTIPVFRWYNGLSIGLDFGRRGLQTSQVKETYFGFSVGMNIFDIWFQKPHYE